MNNNNNNNINENNNVYPSSPSKTPPLVPSPSMMPQFGAGGSGQSDFSLLSGLDSFNSNGKTTVGGGSTTKSLLTKEEIRKRRASQSKSMSYSNFNHLFDSEEFNPSNEEILDICVLLKERLKQLSIQLELDLSEINHKDQEIELLQSRINVYGKDIREKEEENDELQERIKILTGQNLNQTNEMRSMEDELALMRKNWVQPQEIEVWKEQMNVLTLEAEKKDKYISEWIAKSEEAEKKVEVLLEQIKKERDVAVILRQESETAHKQFIQEREQYFKESESSNTRLIKSKSKNYDLNQQLKRMEADYDSSQRSVEKLKVQCSSAEKENIELKHSVETLQVALADSQKTFADLTNSQKSMTQELKHSESERLAMIGLMNRSELEVDEKMLLLISECSKANETINKLQSTIKDMEKQLTDERLTRQISSVSLNNPTFSLTERDLIRMIQEKDEEIQRQLKQIQRLHVDNNNLKSKSKKLEDNINENSNQLQQTKKSLRSSRKSISKLRQELLYISNENFNDSFGNNNNSSPSSVEQRKSLDLSTNNILSHLDDSYDSDDDNNTTNQNDFSFLSPIKNSAAMSNDNLTPNRNRSFTSIASPSSKSNLSATTTIHNHSVRTVDQLEEMLEKARSANLGYRLHIQFLSKEIKSMEIDLQQQRDYTNNIVNRLNMDLEESKRLNSRIRKTFLSRFTREEDLIFLDYYTMTDKFSKPITNENSPIFSSSSSSNSPSPILKSSLSSTTLATATAATLPQPTIVQSTVPQSIEPNQKQNHNHNHLNHSNNNISMNSSNNNIKPKRILSLENNCAKCSKEFSFFVRKYQCSNCSNYYCYDCFNSKQKTCLYCTITPSQK